MNNYDPVLDGSRLRQIRNSKLLTQSALAEKSGLRLETICRLEANQRPARYSTIRKLAMALEIAPVELLTSYLPATITSTSTITVGGER